MLSFGLALAAVLATLASPASGERSVAEQQQALDIQLVSQVNALRAQHGLKPLRYSRPLSEAATRHSVDMALRGYFSHSSSDGTAFWRRIQHFYPERGFHRWIVGENL
ncbi:MAG: hypothetical protein C5B48_15700, partial [Candidatus Rokuibacteriota bacterium]